MAVSGASRAPVSSWVPVEDRRRLSAYYVLDAYRKNSTRNLLRRATWVRRQKQREYGDPSLLTKRVRSGVLGDDFELVLPGADDDLGDAPDLPPRPDPVPDDADEIDRRVFTVAEARWKDLANRTIDEWEEAVQDQPFLQERQQELRDWADRVLLAPLMVEAEDDCVNLGDTIYALFPQPGDWPRVEIYEPDGYFPVLDTKRDGYPTKVHLAWEIEERLPDQTTKRFVERYTWELVEIATMQDVEDVTSDATGNIAVSGDDGTIRAGRRYPWAETEEGEEAAVSTETCLFTRGKWELDAKTLSKVPDLDLGAAVEKEQIDLECDFLPFVHIPNTPASRDHFGQGSLTLVAQIIDDIGQTDTDLMETARLVAAPAIALSGAEAKDQTIRPLTIFNLGKDGAMTLLDLSVGLEKVMAFADRLADRLFVNSQVPATLVGKVNSSDAPSGIAMLLDAAPFAQLIGTLRMAREPKYRLLLKFAQRMAQTAGVLPPGPTPEAMVAFGSFLPLDKGQVVDHVVALLQAKAISRATGIALLVAGGFTIEDARREITQIESTDFEGAKNLADATGSEEAAAEYLHRVLPEPEEPEAGAQPPGVELPPGPNEPPPGGPEAEPPVPPPA
jgi:hypothetical protein